MKKTKNVIQSALNLTNISEIEPMTDNQEKVLSSTKHLVLHGVAGSGKSFLALYLAIKALCESNQSKIYIIRSAVPTRDMGFLPGNEDEKSKVYEQPYINIFAELCERGDAYETLKKSNIVKFVTTSYLRGLTIDDAVIVVDEAQNMTFHELDSIITRTGLDCRLIFCGDFMQSDLKITEKEGIKKFMDILSRMSGLFNTVEFGIEDIVRSELVKSYLIAKHNL